MAWRYIAQRALTDEFLDWELPLREVEISKALSGPDQLSATISPEMARLLGPDGQPILTEWSTYIYAEEEGQIRFGGILVHSSFEGEQWRIEASGFCGYAHGIPYLGEYTKDNVDPLDVVREIWRHIQSMPDGNLGVIVDDTKSPVRVGKAPKRIPLDIEGAGPQESEEKEPYSLVEWEATDCGEEIDELAKLTPFDYWDEHRWVGDSIEHRLRLAYPRVGRRRTDLRFALGENLAVLPTPERPGDDYANEVLVLGKGEGRKMARKRIANRDGRLRRVHVFTQSAVGDADRLTMLARGELARRQPMFEISEIQVLDHPNAPLGSWQVGDDIEVTGLYPWLGTHSIWCRITSATIRPESAGRQSTLSLARSDSFTYGEVTT